MSLRLHVDTIAALDDLRKMEPDLPSRPEMVRRIIDLHLKTVSQNASAE